MRTPAEVVELYNQRVRDYGVAQQVAREITDLYGGDIAVNLTEVHESERPAVANVARTGIDQQGMRIASSSAEIEVWPENGTQRARNRARDKRRALYGFHQLSRSQILRRYRGRHLVGYASTAVKVVPDFDRQAPVFKLRSPIATYAADTGEVGDPNVPDCIFAHRQTLRWVMQNYPGRAAELNPPKMDPGNVAVDLLEYYDDEVVYLIATRRSSSDDGFQWTPDSHTPHSATHHTLLRAAPNRIGRCPVSIVGAVTLGPRRSPFHQLVGMYQAAAELDSLSRIATRAAIKQEAWLVENPGDDAEIVRVPDQWNGIPGIVRGGQLDFRSPDPQFATRIGVSDLERSQRVTAGIPPELGGEAGSNVRTGRRGEQILRAVMDFGIQEAHDLLEVGGEVENELAALTDLHYFRRVPKVWQVNFGGEKGDLAYVPGELWTDSEGKPQVGNRVSYAMAGLDAAEGIIALGQRLGMGTISKETVMRRDPVVDDVDAELAKVDVEALERAFFARLETLAADPASALQAADLIKLTKLRRQGKDIVEAWEQVEREAVERAQAEANPADPTGPGTVESAGGVPAAIGGPSESQGNLNDLLMQLRGPTFATPGE